MVDPGIVLQKIIVTSVRWPGGFPPAPAESYFGPPDCAPVK
jgi:hypothetical protein